MGYCVIAVTIIPGQEKIRYKVYHLEHLPDGIDRADLPLGLSVGKPGEEVSFLLVDKTGEVIDEFLATLAEHTEEE